MMPPYMSVTVNVRQTTTQGTTCPTLYEERENLERKVEI